MAYDVFTSRVLLSAIEQMQVNPTFMVKTFFPNTEVRAVEYADVDVINALPRTITYCAENDEATLVEKPTRTLKSVKLPFISIKSRLTPSDMLKRPIGSPIYSANMNEAEELNRQIKYLMNDIYEKIDLQAVDALEDGVITITGSGVSDTITFGRDASLTYTISTNKWDNATGDPLKDLRTICALILSKSAAKPNVAVMGSDAMAAFLSNTIIVGQYNMFNANFGSIEPKEIMDGKAAYLGRANVPGFPLDLYTHSSVSAKKVIVGSSSALNYMVYGAVRDCDAGLSATQFYPKIWKDNDPSCYWIGLKSSPLCMLSQPDSTACIQVLS